MLRNAFAFGRRREALPDGKLARMVEALPQFVALLDRAGTILYQNPAAAALLGRSSDGVPPGSWLDLVHEEDRPKARSMVDAVVARAGSEASDELRFSHADGSLRSLRVSLANHLDDPVLSGIVLHGSEVTERGTIRDALAESQTALLAAHAQVLQLQKMEAVSRLAAGIAHDFNNLLGAIQGYAELLLLDIPAEAPHAADIGEIRRVALRGASLTRQLLTFGRAAAVTPRPIDLAAAVDDMASMIQRLVGSAISVDTNAHARPAWIKADQSQIEQVLMNLVVNARDAMPRGGSLRIEVGEAEVADRDASFVAPIAGGRYCVIRVSDTGHGMSAETMSRLFEPFFTTKETGRGTGLGLATIYGIVTNAGGSMRIRSAINTGTTFEVFLPRIVPVPQRPELAETGNAGSNSGSETILVVDDEEPVRSVVGRILRRAGYCVLEASDSNEALDIMALRGGEIQLLVTDLIMPGLGGVDLTDRVRSERPGIRAVWMSGHAPDEAVAARHSARPAFVQKPFDTNTLLSAVRRTLDAGRAA